MKCDVCFTKENEINKCFYSCTINVCDECILKIIDIGKNIKFSCPQCRKISKFDFNVKTRNPFGIFCIVNSIGILKRYSEKYKIEEDSSDEETIVLQPSGGTYNPLFVTEEESEFILQQLE